MEVNNDIFTEEDYKKLKKDGLSDEDINNLKYVLGVSDLADQLPEDIDAFLQKVQNYFPDDGVEALKMYFELPKKDPEFFKQLITWQEFMGSTETPIEETSVADALRQIRYTVDPEEADKLKNRFLVALGRASGEQKTQYTNEVKELNIDEKRQLADILKHR